MLNKTLKVKLKRRIASALRHWRPVVSLVVLIIILFVWRGVATAPASGSLIIKEHTFSVEYVDTPLAQAKGLGGRDRLASDHAMLFRFATPSKQCFWMKDMRFNLDIIWLDSTKKVIQIEPNISPSTYPTNYCADNTQYVVEVNAGIAQRLNLQTGDTISF